MKTLVVELPSLFLDWQKDNGEHYICSAIRTNYPKISPLVVSAIARSAGYEVEGVDMKIRDQGNIVPYKQFRYGDGVMVASRKGMNFEDLESRISDAEVLSLSCNPTQWAQITTDFIKYSKSVKSGIKVIIGGTDAMMRPDYYLRNGADFVVLGEGENSGVKLYREIAEGGFGFDKIPGIAFMAGEKIVINPRAPRGIDLDTAHLPDFETFKGDIPLWTTPIEYWPLPEGASPPIAFADFSRGCAEKCGYCTAPIKNPGFRVESLRRIAEKLDYYRKWGIQTINIWDENIGSLIKLGMEGYLERIISLLKEKGFAFEYSEGGMAISYLWDKKRNKPKSELINRIFSNEVAGGRFVGNYAMYFPFENLQAEDPSKVYGKLLSFEREKEVLGAMLDAGMRYVSYATILGLNEDTLENLERAKRRLHEVNDFVTGRGRKGLAIPFCYMPLPGTNFYEKYAPQIVYDVEDYPELIGLHTSVIRTSRYEPHEITQLKIDMERELLSKKEFEVWRGTGRYFWEE